MSKHEGHIRGFYWCQKAWYADPIRDNEINFGIYSPEGGTSGEMGMEWVDLGANEVPQLNCFDDGWSALATFTDLIDELGKFDNQKITQEQFVDVLLALGFTDMTQYVSPHAEDRTELQKRLAELESEANAVRKQLGNSK